MPVINDVQCRTSKATSDLLPEASYVHISVPATFERFCTRLLASGIYPFGKTHVVGQRFSLGEILHLQGLASDYHTTLYRSTSSKFEDGRCELSIVAGSCFRQTLRRVVMTTNSCNATTISRCDDSSSIVHSRIRTLNCRNKIYIDTAICNSRS